MKRKNVKHLLLSLGLLFGAIQGALATDRFYMEAVNIEPGETRELEFCLENGSLYYGFQANLKLPAGLEVVTENGKPSIALSERADNSFMIVSNTLADGTLRFGTFSTSHASFTGDRGELFAVKVKAADDFAGGEIAMNDILFVGAGDKDVEFPDISITLGNVHDDKAFIPDFSIAAGGVREISLELVNESAFTAFQADIILPAGLTIQEGSFRLSDRASDHTISSKSFSDGRTRIVCLSLSSTPFSGRDGTLVSFTVLADKYIAEKSEIRLNNLIFTTPRAHEYILPNSVTTVTSTGHSGVDSADANELSVYVDDETVTVNGQECGAAVRLTDMSGRSATYMYEGHPLRIKVEQSGVYILTIGKQTLKIVI